MKKNLALLLLLVFILSCSTPKYAPSIRFPYQWLDVQGFGGNIDKQQLAEPSGVCYHPLKKTLFVVSDDGVIAEMKTDGTPIFKKSLPGDLEGVTVDPETGLLYVAVEADDVILEFDPDKREVTRRFPLNREYKGDPNFLQKQVNTYDNGIECIAFVPDKNHPEGGTFYVGNQWDPPVIMEVYVPLKSSRAAEAEARILRVLPFKMDDPAAIYYDSRTKHLNIVDDADNIFVEITLDGRLVKQYAFLGDNQEGLARDDDGYLYIAQDSGGIIKVKDLRQR
jgi:uncharacterized protein YjiK